MQDFALVEDFTALENVMIPLNFSKQKIKNKKEKALAALKSVGIGELAKKPCNKLSGGQKQSCNRPCDSQRTEHDTRR